MQPSRWNDGIKVTRQEDKNNIKWNIEAEALRIYGLNAFLVSYNNVQTQCLNEIDYKCKIRAILV
jgi:hypothetical protein